MKYPYTVVHNGKWYAAGTEVPTDTKTSDVVESPKSDSKEKDEEVTVRRGRKAK